MKKIYFISGIGADKRAFSFLDLSFCEPVFIDWIPPYKKETLPAYAARLRKEIKDEHPLIVGLSFGGMLATEMAKKDEKISAIIISSTKLRSEFPWFLRLGKYIPVYKLFFPKMMKTMASASNRFLGARGPEQKKVVSEIIKDSDMPFVKWAISAIVNWENKTRPGNLVHIHGTGDKLLPFRLVEADHIIEKGTHVMPMDNHEEISKLLKQLISL